MYKYKLSSKEKRALEDFKQRLKSQFGDNLITIKLFGSRVRGDVHSESDIDLLVVFERRTKKVENNLVGIICDILNLYGVYFEVVSYSREEYKQSKSQEWPFILNIEREARVV